MIETVRISPAAKDQLITLKRRTGLKHWNELGRWALCRSLAEPSRPPDVPLKTEGGIEIDWRTFVGRLADVYLDLICQRCVADGLDPDAATVNRQLHLHLHRGIGYLAGERPAGGEQERRRKSTAVRDLTRTALDASVAYAASAG